MLLHRWATVATTVVVLFALGAAIQADDQKKSDKNVTTIKVEDMT
jgi:hypothetical protein